MDRFCKTSSPPHKEGRDERTFGARMQELFQNSLPMAASAADSRDRTELQAAGRRSSDRQSVLCRLEFNREQKRPDSLPEQHFDSFLQPVLEGVRSLSIGTRHMLYRADPFQIDLLIESQVGGRSVVVTGQLLDLRHPEIVGHNPQVTLSNLRGRVVQVTTNQFGEFCQEIENTGNLELKFHGANHKPVVISLRDDLGA